MLWQKRTAHTFLPRTMSIGTNGLFESASCGGCRLLMCLFSIRRDQALGCSRSTGKKSEVACNTPRKRKRKRKRKNLSNTGKHEAEHGSSLGFRIRGLFACWEGCSGGVCSVFGEALRRLSVLCGQEFLDNLPRTRPVSWETTRLLSSEVSGSKRLLRRTFYLIIELHAGN